MKKGRNIKRDIEVLFEIGTFRYLDRVWKQFLNMGVANCAEHSFRVAWVALTLARYEKDVDFEKLLKMALVHDLAESRTGDVNYISRQYTKRMESEAVSDIFKNTSHDNEMIEICKEYEERKSLEAKIVKDADTIDVDLELQELSSKGSSLGRLWKKHRKEFVYPKIYTKMAKKFWSEIVKADPHDWHVKSSKNRFNGGDWKR